MCVACSVVYTVVAPGLLLLGAIPLAAEPSSATQAKPSSVSAKVYNMNMLTATVSALSVPDIQSPAWLKAQDAAEAAAAASASKSRTVTYSVSTRGTLTASLAEFRAQANATLNDNRGWSRLGVVFQEVASGGGFTLVLSEASQVPSFSSGCSAEYSCRVGQYIIINQDRWTGATTSWSNGGGSLRDYRHMVINHETGHWLGLGHESCGGAGQPAPVMQQQSIDLQGCAFNAWPLTSELYSTQLGIDKR